MQLISTRVRRCGLYHYRKTVFALSLSDSYGATIVVSLSGTCKAVFSSLLCGWLEFKSDATL